ncbi:MAG: alpha/beta hydrolase [Gammaproteobacteria bacterium]|nr:alpha/beta hydrolase [Gammaproteobacteria bacterium]MYD02629.1 alpha/beta hydrolase [Gammaproteobacteria bacterium]MYI24143.1 alpha/beta hydrolase [Gammaproteobacteria bacterium]
MSKSTRRAFVGGAIAAAGLQGAGAHERSEDSVLFVLVHGTGHGGWCWKFVRDILGEQGHRVYTPTLTGCGERSHLLHPGIGLDLHIQDIVNVLEWEELENVVLVGHSYAGLVISGVADRAKDRLRHLVYLDAIVPRDGDSLLTARRDISPEEMAANEQQLRRIAPDGNYIAGFSAERFGIPPEPADVVAWVERRLTPHPIKSWLDPVEFENGGEEGVPCTFIECTEPAMPGSGLNMHAKHAQEHPDWRYVELKTGHDAMVTAPQDCADLFLAAARSF